MTESDSPRRQRLRLDQLVVERGLAPSRAQAQGLIMAGQVLVEGKRVDKAGASIWNDAQLSLERKQAPFVSRGGEKLQGALESFAPAGLSVEGCVAADFGASTGGFVDCLLRHGASRVHAIDVGHGLLHEKLVADPRVIVHDRTNARNLTAEQLGEPIDLVVIDASFISLSKLLGAAHAVLAPTRGQLVALIKPQFEAGRQEVSRGRGVIRDDTVRQRIIDQVLQNVREAGFEPLADAPCVIAGPKGNHEHFVYARVACALPSEPSAL